MLARCLPLLHLGSSPSNRVPPGPLLATLSPQATSSVPSLCSTHAFSLCSGLAVDYFDGGKDQVSTHSSAERLRNVTRGKEKGCCYQKTAPRCQGRASRPCPACVSSVSESTEQGSTNLISPDPARAQSPEISASLAFGKAAAHCC